jgi:hypothetical protein
MLVVFAAISVAAQKTPKGAKEIFFSPGDDADTTPATTTPATTTATSPAPPKNPTPPKAAGAGATRGSGILGLSYWIEVVDGSGAAIGSVTDDHVFRSGDRIRLHFRSNGDGRIMLLQVGASGTASVLFPDPAKGVTYNALLAQQDQVLPSPKHWFKFDQHAGTETLLVLFARHQDALNQTVPAPPLDSEKTAMLVNLANPARGGKDLMIESETEDPANATTYAANAAGKPIILRIVLKHR